MKRSIIPIIIILSLFLSLSGPIQPVQATGSIPFLDQDQDGIPNTMEAAGWFNLSGGPYMTNPNQADTDLDGLTDAEEKLFNTNPMDPKSPGISVRYESAYKTFEYYNTKDPAYLPMAQGGNKYLLTEGVVLRRGTTFKINAQNSTAAQLTVSGAGMTPLTLTPVRDPIHGGWDVTLPANGSVGTYTATITNGAWSKSMPIYIIFELPTGLTPAQTSAFVYDDDPANKRDETAVWWRAIDWRFYNNDLLALTPCTPADQICSNWRYHTMAGYAQAFWTEQFTKKVLLDYTLPAISGMTGPYAAAQAIGTKADESVRTNFSSVKNSFSSATKVFYDPINYPLTPYSTNGGACETNAGVFTAMLRSVGIASKPFAMDYNKTFLESDNKTIVHGESGDNGIFEYDHAVTMWVKGLGDSANRWYAERTFLGAETEEYKSTPVWASGTTPIRALDRVGDPVDKFRNFQDYKSDLIQSANEAWDFQNGSLGGGLVNTEWTGIDVPSAEFVTLNRDFIWNSRKPLQIQQSPYVDILNCQLWKGDGWAPSEWYPQTDPLYGSDPAGRGAIQTYYLPANVPDPANPLENWPYNPQPTSCSSATTPAACDAFKLAWKATCTPLPGQTLAAPQPQAFQPVPSKAPALNTSIQLGSITADAGVDTNHDGRFDQLVVKFEVTSSLAGEYQLGGWMRVGDRQIRADISRVALAAGLQTVEITFNGQQIGDNKINGPYQVETIWIAAGDQSVSELALPEEMAAYQTYTYASQAYPANTFAVLAASIAGSYSYTGTDTNGNGQVDAISISVPLSIAISGTFTVDADLYDGQGGYVGHAAWTGNSPNAALDFKIAGTLPPYSLEHLNLTDARGKMLSSSYASVYKINDLNGKVDQASITPGNSQAMRFAPLAVTPTNAYNVTPVDANANGRYDQLLVTATVNVTVQGGSYWMEGLLVDDLNTPVAWSVGNPQTLIVGPNQTLQIAFDTRMLFDQLPLAGSQKFTLVAVKIFSGTPALPTLEADVPVTGFATPVYSRTQFEPANTAYTLFQDDQASGTAKWVKSSPSQWSQTNNSWHSWTNAWMANGSATVNGVLSLATPLDLKNYASPWLKFNTAYQLSDGQSVKLEGSKDGTTWTTLKTYTGLTSYRSAEMIDLGLYAKTAGVRFRFNAQTYPGATWYVDDLSLIAGPAVASASFTHAAVIAATQITTLTADYVSINKTLPVTYRWDFCGVAQESVTPTINYAFPTVGNCQVALTVDNSYDSVAAAPQIISVTLPLTTNTPTSTPTATATAKPTATPTGTLTATPTATPTAKPTATPTVPPQPISKHNIYLPSVKH